MFGQQVFLYMLFCLLFSFLEVLPCSSCQALMVVKILGNLRLPLPQQLPAWKAQRISWKMITWISIPLIPRHLAQNLISGRTQPKTLGVLEYLKNEFSCLNPNVTCSCVRVLFICIIYFFAVKYKINFITYFSQIINLPLLNAYL